MKLVMSQMTRTAQSEQMRMALRSKTLSLRGLHANATIEPDLTALVIASVQTEVDFSRCISLEMSRNALFPKIYVAYFYSTVSTRPAKRFTVFGHALVTPH